MPIRKELRHFYSGAPWKEARERILKRARNRCEECGAPNRKTLLRHKADWSPQALHAIDLDRPYIKARWFGPSHRRRSVVLSRPITGCRFVMVILTVAHLDHEPANLDDSNLRAFCQFCHLMYDRQHHHETRADRKDRARPLFNLLTESTASTKGHQPN